MKASSLFFLLAVSVAPYANAQTDASAAVSAPDEAQPASPLSAEGTRYQQALKLGFYHEAYQRCSQGSELSEWMSVTRQSLAGSASARQSGRLTDLLYQEMAGAALGTAMQQDSDGNRCTMAGEAYRQLRNADTAGAMKSFFGIDMAALDAGKAS